MPPESLRHLIDWHLLDEALWWDRLEAARRFARERRWTDRARGRAIALLFFNPSLRTRTSMELAAAQLGAHVSVLVPGQGTWGFEWRDGVVMEGPEAEHIQEAIGVLSRYYDAIGVRAFASLRDYEQDRSEAFLRRIVRAASVPIINLESAFWHPCQALGDAATLMDLFRERLAGRSFLLTWAYHPKALPMAVPNSALLMATRLSMRVTIARPAGYELDPEVMALARQYAAQHGLEVRETDALDEAFEGAEVVYAKAWGGRLAYTDPEAESQLRLSLRDWRVTEARMRRTREAVFMHCLPVRRNVVVDDAVLDGPWARHLVQAEYRLHAQKAILEWVWNLS
ncbi:MAG: N-acetylornithine carbamoyltransferase [Bacteroidetes bacterium]|nr:N-acetylornithine carbamoyltransferase [Rhodothermia bacterium]MCS7155360.1 N-acetylornithine carbamoyltransferase [Bacteroidota bacterium]MCX7907547.1 N-acetylornithine carbamoyltransferase [Bacteroidota bacterium]MDW8138541.1 N-acetylornithine carbamoyltransferase [Bacteroidota bacterium]MDW8284522.1 N-acetylornithine carbamoyltransferase [Bacteroidota bacterium]